MGRDEKTTRVPVTVQPYGTDYVNVISGLNGGEILKAQSSSSKSGKMKVSSKNSPNAKRDAASNDAPPPMPPM